MPSPQACLMSLFHGAISIVLTPDSTLGARIMASAAITGTAWIGIVLAGAMVRAYIMMI